MGTFPRSATVDHDLMMLKLERQFGLRGVVLDWFRSYLCGRTYQVIHGARRHVLFTLYVPCPRVLFTVLGPRMFILYAADLEDVAAKQREHSRL